MKHSHISVGAVLLCLATAFLASGCGHSQAATNPVDVIPVVGVSPVLYSNLSRKIVLTAEFRPYQQVDLHAKVAGYVREIRVDVGDHVKKGELLATLEIPELQDEIHQASAAIRQDQAELKRAQAAHAVAHLAFTRLQGVDKAKPGLVAQQEIDDASSKDLVTAAQVSAAEQQLEVAQASLSKLQTMYAYSNIVAPFTGVVTKRFADTGSLIQAGTASETQAMPLVTLSQNDFLRLIVPVPESAVPDIHLGTPVLVRVPALNKVIQGKVARFADTLDLDTRTMNTEIDVPNPSLEFVPGMYAEASITLAQHKNVLTVPVEAVDHHGQDAQVYRVSKDGLIEEQTIQTGLETSAQVEVRAGLKANDVVVISGRGQLHPGEKVTFKRIPRSPKPQES